MNLKFGFGRDVPLGILKVDPYIYQFFKKVWPIRAPIGLICSKIWPKLFFPEVFLKFEPILTQIWENFEKLDPSIYHISYAGHW